MKKLCDGNPHAEPAMDMCSGTVLKMHENAL